MGPTLAHRVRAAGAGPQATSTAFAAGRSR